MAKYDNILGTVGRTPVVKINKLAPKGVNLYVKIEAFNPLGSVKDRLALGVIEAAETVRRIEAGADRDRSHLRQYRHRARHGLRRQGLSAGGHHGRELLGRAAQADALPRRQGGARRPAAERAFGMVNKAQELAKTHGWFLTRQFENEANPDMHSRTTAREIVDDFKGEKLDYWVTGFGTGGTLTGVSRVLRKERPDTKIVVCEPTDAPMLTSGIGAGAQPGRLAGQAASLVQAAPDAGLEPRLHPEDHRRGGRHEDVIDRIVTVPGADAHQIQPRAGAEGRHLRRHHRRRHLRRRAGSVQTAAPGSTVLAMLPDTGERYLSTPLFADVAADMTEEEVKISNSTPSNRMPPKAA